MNYIHGEDRNQMRIESLESFASPDSEVRVIDKIVDAMDIESLGFKLGNNSKRVTSSPSRTPGGFKIFQWQA